VGEPSTEDWAWAEKIVDRIDRHLSKSDG